MNIFGVIITKSRNLFAETFANHALRGPFIILSEVDSTNNYAMAKLHATAIQAGSCFQAVEQSAGKGQRGKRWAVKKGENITMSVCLRPTHAEFPFLLSAAMALGCYDFIKESGAADIGIKWPNDVYIGDRKAAGILIENVFLGSVWQWAVVGTGVNVNQSDFGELGLKATSLKLVTGEEFDVTAKAKELHRYLLARAMWMQGKTGKEIMQEYNQLLYRRNEEVRLKKDSAVFTTTIKRVSESGELITADTMERAFMVGDIEFV
jgi:BirA family biotin operon repressor/biotin-[acetyl-CoA-carboxylase] ligase